MIVFPLRRSVGLKAATESRDWGGRDAPRPMAPRKSGSVAESCRGGHMSGGLSHCRPLIIVDNVPPEPVRAAAHDIACRASEVDGLAVGTLAIN